ncbi:hypothetical protein RclHR1_15210005 [Rhizophagus clarus]|uniref:RRM domain-containing protein n=1 Tax=Rhizophagus clarus TaxID=94130 RepID=A0A2Z6R7E4_9GLOM|nr:hypothetical protein RclHR1_15210005 [Rhizophagus clarus]
MSNNNRNNNTSDRTLRSSSKGAQPAATFDFTFTSNAADPSPWSKDTATNNALQADLAADRERIKQSNLQSERDVASDLFADTPNHPPKTYSSKGKSRSKNSRSHLSRAQAPSQQNIVNNLDGTNRTPTPAAPAVTPEATVQNDQQQNDQTPDKEIVNSAMDVDPPSDNNENSDQQSITIEKPLDYVALVALDNIIDSKPSKLNTIKEALAKYNVKNNNTSARTLRSSSKGAQPAATFDFTFTSNAADPPPWSKDTATNNALQADLAADRERIKQSNLQSERDVASDLFADTPNHPPKTYSSKGKSRSKNSRSHLSRAQAPSQQNIVNNLDGTNRTPTPAAPAVTPEATVQNDQQQNDQTPDKEIVNSAMDVDPPSDNNENSDQQSITIEKPLDYVAFVALDNIIDSKPSKLNTIKEALAKYNVKYNINLGITRLQKQAKVTFNDKDSYDKFLKMEIILQLKKDNSDDIKNVTLKIFPLKPEKQVTTPDQQKENTNYRTIQVIDIPAYRKAAEIRASFEILGEIERLYTKGAGFYQIAYITYKSQEALTYFETNWRYHVGKDTVRILSLSLNQDDRTVRKQFPLKLSELAYNTSGYDLEPVLLKCKAKSCFIPAAMIRGRYSKCRYAYIHFSCDED